MSISKSKIREELTRSMSEPFKRYRDFSEKGQVISKRENDVNTFIKRILSQIIEYHRKGWSMETPEDWDSHLLESSLGKAKRSSDSILSRMDWTQFLLKVSEELQNLSTNFSQSNDN